MPSYKRSWRGDSNADHGLTRPALFLLSYTSAKLWRWWGELHSRLSALQADALLSWLHHLTTLERKGRDRAEARAPRRRDQVTFPRAPLQSRKVGFPDSGFDLGFPREVFPRLMELKRSLTCTPTHFGLPRGSS